MPGDLLSQSVELPSGALDLLQPRESAELPDSGPSEWAPVAPYWSVLWRSGIALARELDEMDLRDHRLVELGCGMAVPSIVAARAGADALATDADADALPLVARNAERNGVTVETAAIDWSKPEELLERAPFDAVLAADILYEPDSVDQLLELLPRLAPEVWLADPGRLDAIGFLERAAEAWSISTRDRGLVLIHLLELRA